MCSEGTIVLENATVNGGASTAAWEIVTGQGTLSSTSQTGSPESVTYTAPEGYKGTVVLRLTSNDPTGPCEAIYKELN